MFFLPPTRRFSLEGEGTEINYLGVIYSIFTGQLSISRFHCVCVEGAEWYCTILGTRLSETVCSSSAVGLIGVNDRRRVFLCVFVDYSNYVLHNDFIAERHTISSIHQVLVVGNTPVWKTGISPELNPCCCKLNILD